MIANIEEINQTVQDLESCLEVILERHKDNPTLCLKFDSVFKQLINSLNHNTGRLSNTKASFEAKPLTKILGREVKEKTSTKMILKPLEINEVEAFKEKIKIIYDSFLSRENENLLESLQEIEIRGVAKLAGLPNYDKANVDGKLIDTIKEAISAKNELESKKIEEKTNLANKK